MAKLGEQFGIKVNYNPLNKVRMQVMLIKIKIK